MTGHTLSKSIQAALDQAKKCGGLPLSIQMREMSTLSRDELVSLCALAGPLLVWRGRLCYQYDEQPASTTLEPAWILYAADEQAMSPETAAASNHLAQAGELVALPAMHYPETLAQFGKKIETLPRQASNNFNLLTGLYSQLESLRELPVAPLVRQKSGVASGLIAKLPLPVLVDCPHEQYSDLFLNHRDELVRLRHALRDLFQTSQELATESMLTEVMKELDYQISRLNTVYALASRTRNLAGSGVIVGSVITAISFFIPAELRPFLLSLGTPSTIFAGLKWLGQIPDAECRLSDYYLAWRFQTK